MATASRKALFRSSTPSTNSQLGHFFQILIGITLDDYSLTFSSIFFWKESCRRSSRRHFHWRKSRLQTSFLRRHTPDGGSSYNMQDSTNRLVASICAYVMKVSIKKPKVMTVISSNTIANNTLNGEPLEEVSIFKYSRATLSNYGLSTAEIRTMFASATAWMARLNRIWKINCGFPIKFRLFKYLVISILLYGCESWTLLTRTERWFSHLR